MHLHPLLILQTFLDFEVTAVTPLSFVGEDDLSDDVSTTPALVGGGCPGTSVGIDNLPMES